MKKKTLVLCDTESAFTSHFSEYYNRGRIQPFELRVFTSVDALTAFAFENTIDILLIAETLVSEEIRLPAARTLLLTEMRACGTNAVSKYQAAPDILKAVITACPEASSGPDAPGLKPPAKVLVVYSPISRCFKTTFALTAGQILALDHPTLYINLEESFGHSGFVSGGADGNIADAIFAYRQQEKDFISLMTGMTKSIGSLQVLPPTPCPEELWQVTRSEWTGFFQLLEKNAGCDYLLVDVGSGAGALRTLLEEADIIYLPTLPDDISQAKLNAFRHRLSIWDSPSIQSKLIELTLPTCNMPDTGERLFERLAVMPFGDHVRRILHDTLS